MSEVKVLKSATKAGTVVWVLAQAGFCEQGTPNVPCGAVVVGVPLELGLGGTDVLVEAALRLVTAYDVE